MNTRHAALAAAAAKLTAADLMSPMELQARALLRAARDIDWTPARAVVLNVFVAHWSSALTLDRVAELAAAANQFLPHDICRAALTSLVRDGALRSEASPAGRLWEVNLA